MKRKRRGMGGGGRVRAPWHAGAWRNAGNGGGRRAESSDPPSGSWRRDPPPRQRPSRGPARHARQPARPQGNDSRAARGRSWAAAPAASSAAPANYDSPRRRGGGGGGGGLGHPAWKAAPGTAAFPRRPGAAACRREAVRAAARPGARISGEERGRAGLCLFSLDSHRAQGPFRGGRGAGEGREGERTAACAARSAALYAQKRKGPAAAAARGPACAPPGRQGARTDTGSGCTAPSFLLFFLHLRPPLPEPRLRARPAAPRSYSLDGGWLRPCPASLAFTFGISHAYWTCTQPDASQ